MFRRPALVCVLASALVAGCASEPRLPPPSGRLSTALPAGFGSDVRFLFDSVESFRQHSERTLAQIQAVAPGGRVSILALSGGGAGGAFGAGLLVGWSRTGTRPTFQLVTGVSVGALIAPFAFLGSEWDGQLTEALSGEGSRNLLHSSFFRALVGSSLYSGQPLKALVEKYVTTELLEAVAREYRGGRLLLIETTDFDRGEPVIWNMGAIAAQGGPEARALFCQVLEASASIPAVFPPVVIRVAKDGVDYDEMHIDGATSMPVFVAPEIGALAHPSVPLLQDAHLFVIANTNLGRFPTMPPTRTLDMFRLGLDTNLVHGLRAAIGRAYTFAENYGIAVEVAAVPAGYPFKGALDFNPSRMHRLFEYAVRCSESQRVFKEFGRLYRDAMTAPPPDPDAEPQCPVVARDR